MIEEDYMTGMPKDFSDALKESGLAEFFSGCAASHRREYLKWITGAKRPETRKERIKKAVKMLSDKCAKKTARSKKNL
ncbi:MAG: YdeI/OmpD-associated family protein [Verrucomicrobiota bacterium]